MASDDLPRVVLVQCVAGKQDRRCEARRLYDSDYFDKQRRYAEVRTRAPGDEWFIQSAEHGLVSPSTVLSPYDTHVDDLADPEAWGEEIAADLAALVSPQAVVEVLGGAKFADPVTPALEARGFDVVEPMRGMYLGERKAKLLRMTCSVVGEVEADG